MQEIKVSTSPKYITKNDIPINMIKEYVHIFLNIYVEFSLTR